MRLLFPLHERLFQLHVSLRQEQADDPEPSPSTGQSPKRYTRSALIDLLSILQLTVLAEVERDGLAGLLQRHINVVDDHDAGELLDDRSKT